MTPKSLEAVTALATIARVGSFTRAAGELGVSRSALSHRIKTLEEILGVRVLNRTTRSLALTGAGEHLIAAVHPSLESISAALEEVAAWDGEPKGKLRLSVPRIAGLTVIRPRLSEFVRRYPGVELELSVNDGLVDIVAGGFDAGIRFLESVALDMVTVAVGPPVEFAAVAAPEYLTGRALPIHPTDLLEHACLRYRMNSSGRLYAWEFSKGGEEVEVHIRGQLTLNSPEMMLHAALDGHGFAYLSLEEAKPFLRDGRLVRALSDWCEPAGRLRLYYPQRRHVSPALRALIAVLS